MDRLRKIYLLIESENKLLDLKNFFLGCYFSFLYKNKLKFLISKKRITKFWSRMRYVSDECYRNGECEICSCDVPGMFWVKDCKKKCKLNNHEFPSE